MASTDYLIIAGTPFEVLTEGTPGRKAPTVGGGTSTSYNGRIRVAVRYKLRNWAYTLGPLTESQLAALDSYDLTVQLVGGKLLVGTAGGTVKCLVRVGEVPQFETDDTVTWPGGLYYTADVSLTETP